ncbi:MAG: HAD family hydrolase [Christensenellales bacterium]
MQLFVSDLDGTLLTGDQVLSPRTAAGINRLIQAGCPFTVATARSWESARKVLAPLRLRLPAIASNGVMLVDPATDRPLVVNDLGRERAEGLVALFEGAGRCPMVYTLLPDGTQRVYYKRVGNPAQQFYIDGRVAAGDPRFRRVDRFELIPGERIFEVAALDMGAAMAPLYAQVRFDPDLCVHDIDEVYFPGGRWLEIYDAKAGKDNALRELIRMTGAQQVTVFGDQPNDLPMFAVADCPVAVANAAPEVRAAARQVIGHHDQDAVLAYLESRWLPEG